MRRRFKEEKISQAIKMLIKGIPAQKVLDTLQKKSGQRGSSKILNKDFEMLEELELKAVEIANQQLQKQIDQYET